jgi:putative membrane protein
MQPNCSKEVMVMGESHLSTDSSDENARKQVYEGIEGALTEWARTSLTLIGFGLALGEAFNLIRTGGPANPSDTPRGHLVTVVAFSLVALGTFSLLGVAIQCGWCLKCFKQGYVTTYERPWLLTLLVVVLLVIVGLVSVLAMALP